MSESNRVRIAYRIGGTGNWKPLRRTGDALTVGTETVTSNEIRDDRKRGGQKVVTQTAGGTIDYEFSAKTFDELMAAAFMTNWQADTPVAGSDQLTVGTTSVTLDILKSYLDEDRHVLISNAQVSQLSITMNAASVVTGQLTVVGSASDVDYDPSGDTFDSLGDELVMDSSNNLGSFLIDAAPVSGMCFTAMTLDLNNNHQSDQCLGAVNQNHWKGSAAVTGSITVRSSAAAFDLWKNSINNTPVQLQYQLDDGSNTYAVDVANAFLAGELPSGGMDAILSFELNFNASAKSDGSYLSVTRTLAP